jgi:aquaporin Z
MQTWQKYAAEVYGTFVLVGIGTGTILAVGFAQNPGILAVSLAFGLALITALSSVGRISGGHFNPAVSLGVYLEGRIGLRDMVGYWMSQLAGAVIASLAFAVILDTDSVATTATQIAKPTVSTFGGLIAEIVFTTVFVLAVLVLAGSRSDTKYLGMGLAYTAVHLIGIVFTGASVNPARSFAPALVGGEWTDFWVYVVGPLVGGALAWVLSTLVVTGEGDRGDGAGRPSDAAAG